MKDLKIKHMKCFLAGLLLVAGTVKAANALSKINPEVKDNYFCDLNENKLSFTPNDKEVWYSVTDGGSLEPSISTKDNCFLIRASRNNHFSNVNWVQGKLDEMGIPWDKVYMTYSSTKSNKTPKELNFAVKGTLSIEFNLNTNSSFLATDEENPERTLKLTCKDVILAQGHNSNGNNWWVFNNYVFRNHSIICTDSKGAFIPVYLKPTNKKGKIDRVDQVSFSLEEPSNKN